MTQQERVAVVGLVGLVIAWWFSKRTTARAPIPSVSTSATFNLGVTAPIRRFAEAIARAEGFYLSGSIPNRANNPGDLKSPTWTYPGEIEGQTLGEGIATFRTPNDGWNALYNQLVLIINSESRNYTLDDTIATMAVKYASASGATHWAANVASYLGVPTSTRLYEVLI